MHLNSKHCACWCWDRALCSRTMRTCCVLNADGRVACAVNLAVSKIAPALMAGNTVVVKPPTQGAAGGAHMMQCFHKAGLPKGVINFVTGLRTRCRVARLAEPLVQHRSRGWSWLHACH